MKSLSISSPTATPEDQSHLKKLISNELGRMKGQLVRIKKGIYQRAEGPQEACPANGGEESSFLETSPIDCEVQKANWLAFRDINRMRPPDTPGEPLAISWPLGLEREAQVFSKNIVVVGGVTNCGKTAFALTLALLNLGRHPITYINSEMSGDELANRLLGFEQVYGIPWKTFYDQAYFGICNCNALSKSDMSRLTGLLDPDAINIVDYMKIHDKFFTIGECLEQIHARLQTGIAVVLFRKDPDAPHLLGKSFAEHLARLVMTIDIDQNTGVCYLQFAKVKAPAKKGDRPECRAAGLIW